MSDEPQKTVTLQVTEFWTRRNDFQIIKGIIRQSERPEAVGRKLTCLGVLADPVIGACYKFTGVAKKNEQYNEYQLHFSEAELSQDLLSSGFQTYLAKECDGIGPGRAEQIVGLFGADFSVLGKTDLLVEKILGITPAIASSIAEWAESQRDVWETKSRLYGAGLTPNLIAKLLNAYQQDTQRILKEECFKITEIRGIGFLTADRIAKLFGMEPENPQRLREGVNYVMDTLMQDQGHTCLQYHTLINESVKLLKVSQQAVIDTMKQMIAEEVVCTQRTPPNKLIRDPNLLEFLPCMNS